MKISQRNISLLVYAAKCITGVLSIYLITISLKGWIDYPWSLISVVLVLSPEGKDALELSITRIKANLVGAVVGVVLLLTTLPAPWNIAAGTGISLLICDRLKLNTGARSTLAAMIIILLHGEDHQPWEAAWNRVLAVVIGCLLGLGITYVFHSLIRIDAITVNSEATKSDKEA